MLKSKLFDLNSIEVVCTQHMHFAICVDNYKDKSEKVFRESMS